MRSLTLTKKHARILRTVDIPTKRHLAKKGDGTTPEYRFFCRFATAVDDALGDYGDRIALIIDDATNAVNRITAEAVGEEFRKGKEGEKDREERKAFRDDWVAGINAQLNLDVQAVDADEGSEEVGVELDDAVLKWLKQTWDLPGSFGEGREDVRRFNAVDAALRLAAKAEEDDEPTPLKKARR